MAENKTSGSNIIMKNFLVKTVYAIGVFLLLMAISIANSICYFKTGSRGFMYLSYYIAFIFSVFALLAAKKRNNFGYFSNALIGCLFIGIPPFFHVA